ncbi:hypothetical protein SKUN_00377 [Spiroplasma kunkelii CR2-3x]|uniref:Uncharacterized protein n=1 Tax=Spiroplasma kunkelii CR2-3x TaxID=273035 RepID=A0A0K2JFU5_SPIKU|nr:hypothetical protein [Spiroplasma kunkelii]ALA97293.1 hypothetical protein SKUN_00377 [Spiroplasma kunkelii CR2-3x]
MKRVSMLSVLTYDKNTLTDTELSVIEQIIQNPILFTSKIRLNISFSVIHQP